MTNLILARRSFILIDGAQVDGVEKILPLAVASRAKWIAPIYVESAATVSPLVIDLQGVFEAGDLDSMMLLINAKHPQLHVSIIDSTLEFEQLIIHLKQFIYVRNDAEEELTLRFADCLVLPELATYLRLSQWAIFVDPISRWLVHQRDGSLQSLPLLRKESTETCDAPPFLLTSDQIEALQEAMGVDLLLSNLRSMRPGVPLAKTAMLEYELAYKTRKMWHAAGRADDAVLLVFALGVFKTNGKILRLLDIKEILAQPDLKKICRDIEKSVADQF